MNLILVTGRRFACICTGCGERVYGGDAVEPALFADLDGAPFESYYCESCARSSRTTASRAPVRRGADA